VTTNAEHTERILTDLKRVVRDSEELLHDSRGALDEQAEELRQRLAHTVAMAKEACGRLQEKTKEVAKATDATIREHPYQSMGIALGVGVLIGVLIARKH
jgi:ElaB/YqjD/DUF883 family membrane-anchored ribosome-binding protein